LRYLLHMEIIKFTPQAVEAIQQYKQTLQIPEGYYLRVGIRQKNESNKRLLIGFDAKQDKDAVAEISGLNVVYKPGEVFFFAGMLIDYVEQGARKGFTFVEQSKS
jgi:iron-sulfur cluster assembly protein